MNVHHTTFPLTAAPSSRDILGTPVMPIPESQAIALLSRFLFERRFTRVGFLNAHNANLAARNADFARTLRSFVVLPDGIGVDLASKMLYGVPFPANLNGTDFIPTLLSAIDRPLTVALIGATRENALRAAERFGEIAPQHRFVFMHDGYFDAPQEQDILADIKRLRPDILLVAMGVPRQEFWITQKITAEHCTMPIAVGALLDFMSGAVPRAPEWLREARLEWIYRLVVEPRRLFRRYILGNPAFLLRVFRQWLTRSRA